MTLKIILLVGWLLIGIFNLLRGKIDKFNYFIVWFLLILELLANVLERIGR